MDTPIAEQPQDSDHSSFGCGLWLFWFGANIFGMGIGWALGWALSFSVPGVLAIIVLGAVTGFFVGGLQWLVLQGMLPRSGLWWLATTVGWAVGFQLGVTIAHLAGLVELGFAIAIGVSTGLFVGIPQWALLRMEYSNPGRWVVVSIIATLAGLVFYRPGVSLMGVLYGAMYGPLTGWLLAHLTAPNGFES